MDGAAHDVRCFVLWCRRCLLCGSFFSRRRRLNLGSRFFVVCWRASSRCLFSRYRHISRCISLSCLSAQPLPSLRRSRSHTPLHPPTRGDTATRCRYLFLLFVPIVMLNMLIAILSNTFAEVMAHRERVTLQQQLAIVVKAEEIARFFTCCGCRRWFNQSVIPGWYPKYVHLLQPRGVGKTMGGDEAAAASAAAARIGEERSNLVSVVARQSELLVEAQQEVKMLRELLERERSGTRNGSASPLRL